MPRIAVGQFTSGFDADMNIAAAGDLARRARDSGADLLVLPELCLSGVGDNPALITELAEPVGGPRETALAAIADQVGLLIVAGYYQHADAGGQPHNTLAVAAPGSAILGRHHKIHVFDAWGYRESDDVTPGTAGPVTFALGDLTVGLMTCYEIRFPERARQVVDAGADVLCVAAAWATGPHKEDHWLVNLRARALETTTWVVAASATGRKVIGRSVIVDPIGVVRAQLDDAAGGLAVLDVDRDRVEWARASLPVLAQRRAAYPSPGWLSPG